MSTASNARTWAVTVDRVTEETAQVRTFRFGLPQGESFGFIPGQFLMFRFPDDPRAARAYSISSSPLESGHFEITFAAAGAFTKRMFGLKSGDALEAKGPYGKWVYQDDIRHAVLISGGTGLAPYRSFLRYALERKLPTRFSLFYSAKTPGDILYREELARWAREGVDVHITVTRPRSAGKELDWAGPTGRLSPDSVLGRISAPLDAVYFVCGPNSLVDDFKAGLTARDVEAGRIRYERWGEY